MALVHLRRLDFAVGIIEGQRLKNAQDAIKKALKKKGDSASPPGQFIKCLPADPNEYVRLFPSCELDVSHLVKCPLSESDVEMAVSKITCRGHPPREPVNIVTGASAGDMTSIARSMMEGIQQMATALK